VASSLSNLIRTDANNTLLASAQIPLTLAWNGVPDVICSIQDHGTSRASGFINGRVGDSLAWQGAYGGVITVDRFAIGALLRTSATNFMAMDLYELVIIGRVVTEAERRAVMRYMGRPRGVHF
jgi:hypothetical protein